MIVIFIYIKQTKCSYHEVIVLNFCFLFILYKNYCILHFLSTLSYAELSFIYFRNVF